MYDGTVTLKTHSASVATCDNMQNSCISRASADTSHLGLPETITWTTYLVT